MKILVINCGSSSLKFQLIDSKTEEALAKGLCERIGIDGSMSFTPKDGEKIKREVAIPDHTRAIQLVIESLTDPTHGVISSLEEIGAVGHRIVHGGERFTKSTLIDDDVIRDIEAISDLAPLHNPANLIGVRACREAMPSVPMVAVFDTAFHQTMPEEAYLYGLPYEYYVKHGIRRYGFHGTSHSYVSHRAAELMRRNYEDVKLVICHLGNGASISAVRRGQCIDTSMGLTPLEGLIMGTRVGDIDPSVIDVIRQKEHCHVADVMEVLNKKSGVYGLSNYYSSDFRDLEEGYEKSNEDATRAVKTFCYHVLKYIGSYVAANNGIHGIVFTAGIGENSPLVRRLIVRRLGFLGIQLDEEANNSARGVEKEISTLDSLVKVWVIPTNEELAIARDTYKLCHFAEENPATSTVTE